MRMASCGDDDDDDDDDAYVHTPYSAPLTCVYLHTFMQCIFKHFQTAYRTGRIVPCRSEDAMRGQLNAHVLHLQLNHFVLLQRQRIKIAVSVVSSCSAEPKAGKKTTLTLECDGRRLFGKGNGRKENAIYRYSQCGERNASTRILVVR